jgi:hypothetical protein
LSMGMGMQYDVGAKESFNPMQAGGHNNPAHQQANSAGGLPRPERSVSVTNKITGLI